jgi:hypothetical protein
MKRLLTLLAVIALTSSAFAQNAAQQRPAAPAQTQAQNAQNAQANTAQLRLTVVDQLKASIPAATIKITRANGTEVTVTTNAQGQVTIPALPVEAVQVHAEFPGFEPFDAPLTLRRGSNDATITLTIAGFQQEIQVADTASVDDTRGNSLTTTLNEAEIAELPEDPDELQAMLEQMTGGAGAVFQVNGFRGGQLPPRDEIRQIRFRVNSFSADNHEAGRVQVQIITRPNVTAWSGNVNLGYRSDALNARNAFAREQTPEQYRRFSGGIRGPLVSGRTSIRLNVDGNRSFDSDTITARLGDFSAFSGQFRRPNEATNVTVGLEHGISNDQTLRIEFRAGQDARDNQGIGGFNLMDRAFSREGSDQQLRVSVQGLYRNSILNETRLQMNSSEDLTVSSSDSPAVRVIDAFTSGGAGQSANSRTRSLSFANDTDFTRGIHVMRAGVLLDLNNYRDTDARNYNGTFTFSSLEAFNLGLPDTFTQRLGTAETKFTYYQLGFYLQDDIRLNRTLSISLGARQEMQSFIDDKFNIMPRVGFTWNPAGSRTAIRGGYGMFYDWYDANLHDQTLRVNGTLQRDLTILNPTFPDPTGLGSLTEVLPGGRVQAAPGLQMPYVQQMSIGLDRPIGTTVTLQSSYQWQRGYNQLRSRNINAPNAQGVRPDPTSGTITQIESTGKLVSDRVTVNANYRIPARQIFLNLGYTWSNVKNHASNATSLPADSYNPDAEWGPSQQDIRHRLFTTINYTAPYGVRLNLTNNFSSAPPYTITLGTDANRDGTSNDRPAGVGRNTERGFSQVNTSLRLSRSIGFGPPRGGGGGPFGGAPVGPPPAPAGGGGGASVAPLAGGGGGGAAFQRGGGGGGFGGGGGQGGRGGGPGGRAGGPNQQPRYNVEFSANVSNLFNRVNYGGVSGNLRSPFFGQATSAGQARRIEVSTSFRF